MEDIPGKEKPEVGPKIYSINEHLQSHSMYCPGTDDLSPKDTAVNKREKKSLCAHLNVGGRGHYLPRQEIGL